MSNTQTIECGHDVPHVSYKRARKRFDTHWSCGPKRPSKKSLKARVLKYRIDPLAKYGFAKYSQFRIVRPQAKAQESLEQRFQSLVKRWRDETSHISSYTDRVLHPAYQELIGMGHVAVPLMLQEMKERGGHWFWALRAITGQNPVSPEDAGKIRKMTECWLQWGKQRGLLE